MRKFFLGSLVCAASFAYADPSTIVLDSENRIQVVRTGDVSSSFKYDEFNNISSEQINGNQIDYSYSDNGELLSMGDKTFSYDDLGRLVKKNDLDISYNAYNMMSKFGETRYLYDSKSGLRCGKVIDGEEIKFILDDFGRVTETRNADGIFISSIEWKDDLPNLYRYGDKIYRYKCNAHGDVIGLFNEEGEQVNSYSYDIFGKEIETKEQVPNPIRYAHEYCDVESGMYYLRGRYYDPSMRRFTTPDPAEDGINHYAYCGNNPFMNFDPSGYAYYSHVVNAGAHIFITKYYSGDDLLQLLDLNTRQKKALSAAISAELSLVNPYIAGACGACLWLDSLASAGISDYAMEARQRGIGMSISFAIALDGSSDMPPEIGFVSAKDVEDYAAGRRKPK